MAAILLGECGDGRMGIGAIRDDMVVPFWVNVPVATLCFELLSVVPMDSLAFIICSDLYLEV